MLNKAKLRIFKKTEVLLFSFDSNIASEKMKSYKIKSYLKNYKKPIIRKFEKRKVYSSFIDNIWGADLADLQLLRKFNIGIFFLLYVIDFLCNYAWVIPLKDKKRYYNY